MNGKTQTATANRRGMSRRYTGVITLYNGKEIFLDAFYKSEVAARNATIRERAKLKADGQKVLSIRTVTMAITFIGYSFPI